MRLPFRPSRVFMCAMGAASLAVAACAAAPATDDAEAIKAAAKGLAEAWQLKNAEGILSYMNDGVTVMAPGSPVMRGRETVTRYVRWATSEPQFSMSMQVDAAGRSGDLGYSRGRFLLKFPASGAKPASTMSGNFVSVFKRSPEGRWTVIEDISSPD